MNAPFLCGVTVAWTIAYLALGVFFSLAHGRLARRSPEYLLFGLLCIALAVFSGGQSLDYAAGNVELWQIGSDLGSAGVIAATALNLHFVMRYTEVQRGFWGMCAFYALAGVHQGLNAMGLWRIPGTLTRHDFWLLGYPATHLGTEPSAIALSFYLLALGTLVLSFWLLLRLYRSGRKDALGALVGTAIVPFFALHDVALVSGWIVTGFYLLPHVFLIYALAVGHSLIRRDRQAAIQLEDTRERLELRTAELERSYQDLEVLEQELTKQHLLASVGELAAVIAHEVRNPLAVMVNAVAGLRRSTLGAEDKNLLLAILEEETTRLDRLVTDLLRFARPVRVARSEVSLTELVRKVLSGLSERYRARLSIPPGEELDTVFVDEALLKLVLENLLENACQAMPDGGMVTIAAQPATLLGASAVCLRVSDRGHGMDAETRQRATKPFFTTRPTGTGLGLAIVERIVEAHGGELGIASEPGEGTTVSILLPRGDPRQRARRWTSSGLLRSENNQGGA
jgi:signal transduction histidine kinase